MKAINNIYTMNGQPGMTQQDLNNLAARIARIEKVTPYKLGGNKFSPSDFSTINSSGVVDGKLNLAESSAIEFKGVLSPNLVNGQFTIANPSDSTATIYWDGTNSSRVIIISRPSPQGTGLSLMSVTVPPSSITITGLTPSTQYQVFPYFVPDNGCGVGFSNGQHGTPQIAFASTDSDLIVAFGRSTQTLIGREPLGNVSWTQPALGGTSPAGNPINPPARQPGTCVKLGTHIDPVEPIGPWDMCTVNHRNTDWIFLETESGRNLSCTPNHPLYDEDYQQQRADYFSSGKWIATSSGEGRFFREKLVDVHPYLKDCTKVQVKMRTGHLFLANGFLSHNIKLDLE